jgi:DNA-directed RNA polymerase subunit RPC12/RpoP
MAIEYQCKNCSKKFKVREFMGLAIFTKDSENTVPGRKCDSCGREISVDDKSVTM